MCAPDLTTVATAASKGPASAEQASAMEGLPHQQQQQQQQQHEVPDGLNMAMASRGQAPTDRMQVEAAGQLEPQKQKHQQQQQLPALMSVLEVLKRTGSVSSSSSSSSSSSGGGGGGGSCKSQWGNTGASDVTWGSSQGGQHHAASAVSSRASSASAKGAARSGAPLGRTGGCKRPLSASCSSPSSSSSLSSLLADADAQNLAPEVFLHRILRERGYETEPVPADKQVFFQPPTARQIQDYDLSIINAVKAGDLESLRQLAADGRQMDACNRHGESVVHISCRRGHAETLRFLLENGGRVHMCDDLGRTPLHDACWAKTPVFDCISTIMDLDPSLIRVVDCRGATPLAYIRREHWPVWRQFFDSKKDIWWAPRTSRIGESASTSSASSVSSSASSGSLSELMDTGGARQQQPAEGGDRIKRVRSSNALAAEVEGVAISAGAAAAAGGGQQDQPCAEASI